MHVAIYLYTNRISWKDIKETGNNVPARRDTGWPRTGRGVFSIRTIVSYLISCVSHTCISFKKKQSGIFQNIQNTNYFLKFIVLVQFTRANAI